MQDSERSQLPIIDVGSLVGGRGDRTDTAAALGRACRDFGFFYITGHGVSAALQQRLEQQCRRFFAQDQASKMALHMSRGGRAWRGYFPVGEELTSGLPDQKEGLYFGSELADSDPRVLAGTPLHGRNLFPLEMPALREAVLEYMAAMTRLGHALLTGIALSLGLPADYFATRFGSEPLTLFRVFSYPPGSEADPRAGADAQPRWGVGEHTDYGVLTILRQDDSGGLEVKSRGRWIQAPPLPDTFVCNLGDMLDRMTGGRYRSTPHRVRNLSGRHRLSFPFFFDPAWDAEVRPIELPASTPPPPDDQAQRWDRASVHAFRGTYGEYLLSKVGKVFPDLQKSVLHPSEQAISLNR